MKMYIVTANCYQCEEKFNLAMIKDDEKRNGFCGPERFDSKEIKIAENNGVIIQMRNSRTMQESYNANVCPHCKVFVGQHFLFTDYFVEAMNGYCEFKTVELI